MANLRGGAGEGEEGGVKARSDQGGGAVGVNSVWQSATMPCDQCDQCDKLNKVIREWPSRIPAAPTAGCNPPAGCGCVFLTGPSMAGSRLVSALQGGRKRARGGMV